MPDSNGVPKKSVGQLVNGDETVDYGVVEYREGRKVWFQNTIVTFPSEEDLVSLAVGTAFDDGFRS